MYQYAQMLYLGDGVQQDKKDAMIHFKKASCYFIEKVKTQNQLLRYGLILDNGEVDEIYSQEASIYFKKLAIKGNLDGLALYARYIRTYGGSESERKLAVKYPKTAS